MKLSVERISHELRKAVENGDLQNFISLINLHKLDVNSYSFCGMPALQLACREGQKEFVQWLLDQPQTNLEKMDPAGHRAIYHAVYENKFEILELLIKKGVQLESRAFDDDVAWTPLYLALWFRHTECCRLLIQYGCNVNSQSGSSKSTPLQCAVLRGVATDVIKLLVAKLMKEQADHPGKLINAKRGDGKTALLLACQKKNCAAIELLVEAGADTLAFDKEGNTALILVAFSTEEDQIPTRELSPHLFEVVFV